MTRLIGLCSILLSAAALLPAESIYDFTLKRIDGQTESLADYKGKVVMIVNVASRCGFTPQYAGLQALYAKYEPKGFVILGFPANNFGFQEPGTDAEIKTFCSAKYNVTFPMFSKISVKGGDIAPLYTYLTGKSTDAAHSGDIQWNFTKFLIGRDGKIVNRFASDVTPESPEVVSSLESALEH